MFKVHFKSLLIENTCTQAYLGSQHINCTSVTIQAAASMFWSQSGQLNPCTCVLFCIHVSFLSALKAIIQKIVNVLNFVYVPTNCSTSQPYYELLLILLLLFAFCRGISTIALNIWISMILSYNVFWKWQLSALQKLTSMKFVHFKHVGFKCNICFNYTLMPMRPMHKVLSYITN